MQQISPWLLIAERQLTASGLQAVFEKAFAGYRLRVVTTSDACWLLVTWPGKTQVAFRLAYSPGDELHLKNAAEQTTGLKFEIVSAMGDYTVAVEWPDMETPLLRLTSKLIPSAPLLFPH